MHFQFDYFCSVTTYDNFLVSSGILENTYSMKQPDLYYFETMQMTSLVKVHREYSPTARILHTQFDQACDVILWFQNSIDQAVS